MATIAPQLGTRSLPRLAPADKVEKAASLPEPWQNRGKETQIVAYFGANWRGRGRREILAGAYGWQEFFNQNS